MFTSWVSHNDHLSLAEGQNVAFVVIVSSKTNSLKSLGPILQSHRLCHNRFVFVLSLQMWGELKLFFPAKHAHVCFTGGVFYCDFG